MIKSIGVAIVSTTSLPGQVERNLDQIATFARRAGADGADLLLTPELSASGYGGYPEVLATAEVAGDGPIFRRLSALSRETGVAIGAGFVELEPRTGRRFLAHLVTFPGGNFHVARKYRVTGAEAPLQSPFTGDLWAIGADDSRVEWPSFEVAGVRCAVAICADAGFEGIDARLEREGVELLLLPTGAGGTREAYTTTEDLRNEAGRAKYAALLERVFLPGDAPQLCLAFRRALAAVNLCGYDGKQHYHAGHGSIVTAMGEVVSLVHGLPNLDRQRPMYGFARFDAAETIDAPVALGADAGHQNGSYAQ